MSIKKIISKKRKEFPFIILISFLISFSIARIYVIFLGGWGTSDVLFPMEKYALHHLYYGIGFLIIAGWISINYKNKKLDYISSVLYGIGLGIFFDELGLLLTEFGNYWDSVTYTGVVVIILVFLNILFFSDFWKEVSSTIRNFTKKSKLKNGPWKFLGTIDFVDQTTKKIPESSKTASIFAGCILIIAGFLVVKYPSLIIYWIAAAFFISGFAYIIGAIKKDEE